MKYIGFRGLTFAVTTKPSCPGKAANRSLLPLATCSKPIVF